MSAPETPTTIANEFSELIFTEKCILISALLLLGAYGEYQAFHYLLYYFMYSSPVIGIHFTLFLQCFRLLLRDKAKQRSTYLLLAFICSAFIIGTLYVASEALIAHNALINYASIPEWFAFYFTEPRLPVQLLYTFVAILGNWMCNCLMVSL